MGQHKTNPNSILKAEGKLKPAQRITCRERRELLQNSVAYAFLSAVSKKRTLERK